MRIAPSSADRFIDAYMAFLGTLVTKLNRAKNGLLLLFFVEVESRQLNAARRTQAGSVGLWFGRRYCIVRMAKTDPQPVRLSDR